MLLSTWSPEFLQQILSQLSEHSRQVITNLKECQAPEGCWFQIETRLSSRNRQRLRRGPRELLADMAIFTLSDLTFPETECTCGRRGKLWSRNHISGPHCRLGKTTKIPL